MGLINKIFGSKKTEIEKFLEDFYIKNYKSRKLIQDAIAECKTESKQEGTDNLPENYGDYLIEQAKAGDEKSKKFVEKALLGDATEDDIRQWWNLNDLERRMLKWEDNSARGAAFLIFKDEGLSFEDSIIKVRKTYPIYGDPSDESNTQSNDRPLPSELHMRINRMTTELTLSYFQQYSKDYNSMNAFIRAELRKNEQEIK
jgi:hypothetical protein